MNFALLNRTQQTHLHHRRDIANFIEKQRAAVRLNKAPFPAFIGSSKRPFFVTEQFRFQQGFVECRTVERYQRFFATCATGVNRPGDQLFTGAGIAVDQYRGFRWRDEGDFTEQVCIAGLLPTIPNWLAVTAGVSASILCVCASAFSSVACRLSKSSGLMR